jgi:hypothetical protein
MRLPLEERFAREKKNGNPAMKQLAKDPYSLFPHHKFEKGPNP